MPKLVVRTNAYPADYPYPPPAVVFHWATAQLPFSASAALWAGTCGVAAVGCWLGLARLLRLDWDRGGYALLPVAHLACSYFFQWDLRAGNCNLIFLASLLLGAYFLHRDRPAAAGFFLAAAFSLKLFCVLVIPYLLWKRHGRAFAWTVAFVAAFWLLLPALVFDSSTVDVTSRTLPTNYVQGMFTAPPITSPDIYPMKIAASLLRDRVFEEVRVKRNLSYAPDAFLRSQAANIGGIYVTAVDANQAVRVMRNEITRLQREPVSNDDITGVIGQFLTTYYIGQETNAAQAGSLAEYELIGGGWRNSLDFLAKLRAVTPGDVQRVSQKYMRNIRFVVLGNPANIDKNVFIGQPGN